MPLETDLTVSPYFDDYNETKDYYKILFRPGVAVQARELNQYQTILQKQIERFGDNIFKRGTIVDGCNFYYYSTYPYIKINDIQKDGLTANPSSYVGYYAKSVNTEIGVTAYITNYEDGFESTPPDLKTMYVNYTNSGNSGIVNSFVTGEVVTIYDPRYPVFSVKIDNGGISFSNNDTVVFTSALVINVASGSLTNGEYLYQTSTGANVQIVGIDTVTLASANQIIVRIKPRITDLANASGNSSLWTIANAEAIRNAAATVTGSVEGIIGAGAVATLTTDSTGKIVDMVVTERGSDYTTLPIVTVKSENNTTGITGVSLLAQNYLANVQIASVANAVGNGYAFGVSEGIIYQKGYFTRVAPQTIIVEKYNQFPNNVVVGFDTVEEIVDSNIDTSLLDNALGTDNENAPGANRLKLTPELVIMSSETAAANDNFFVLTEWSEGRPFKQNKQTAYNKINDEMARRTADESGNYSIDKFLVTTRSPANTQVEGNTFSVVVDPGLAYIDGYRVQTQSNFVVSARKGNDIGVTNNQSVTLDFENYVRINEVGGMFQFNTGDLVKLYSAPKLFHSNTTARAYANNGNTTPIGTQIGTARMRSMTYFDGTPGTANAVYKLYLFNVSMNSGKNFREVRSVFYDGTNKGIADVVLAPVTTLSTNQAVLEGISKDVLVFSAGVYSLKSSANNIYTYRTIDQTLTVANNTGRIVKDISSVVGEYYPYSSSISDSDLKQIYVVPTSNSLTSYANLSGTVNISTTSTTLSGVGTSFMTQLQTGDYIYVSNGTSNSVNRVLSIANNTSLTMDANGTYSNNGSAFYAHFPKNVPISLGSRTSGQSGHSANVDANGNILTIQFKYSNGTNMTFGAATSTAANVSVSVNIERRNVTPTSKSATRNRFVKIRVANNAGKQAGPWCLGVPDAFRLRSVYVGNSSVDNTYPNAINDFYIDHNQNASYYDLSFLYRRPNSTVKLESADFMLVEFDYGEPSGAGFFNTVSYTGEANSVLVANNDGLALSNLTTKYNTFEIPELYTNRGQYYDMINSFDFRPYVSSTATPNSTPSNAPTNPAYTISFGTTSDPANDKKFPVPQSTFKTNIEQYLGRIDSVFIDRDSSIFVIEGQPSASLSDSFAPATPAYSMRLNNLIVKPYPNVPLVSSKQLAQILNRNIANERLSNVRVNDRIIQVPLTQREIEIEQPTSYTMEAIGNIERRVSDLEYYVSLSLLESDMKDRIIPSSLDPNLNRFKYGFFVDDFSTTKFSDQDNPSYAATIEQDDVLPEREIYTITYPGEKLSCDYIDWPIVSQDNATNPPVPQPNCQPNTIVSNSWIVAKELTTKSTTRGKEEVDVKNFTMASISAPVTLYAFFYSGADRIEIYQGNTLILQSNSAQNLTSADKTKMLSNTVPSSWFTKPNYTVNLNNAFSLVSDTRGQAVKNAFKISWTHNPANGLNYTVKVTKYTSIWRYAIEYPINSNTVACNTSPNTTPQPPIIYNGTMVVSPSKFTITYTK
jgi:hypothetical protein